MDLFSFVGRPPNPLGPGLDQYLELDLAVAHTELEIVGEP